MIRTCPVCHEPCLWPDTLCACCRKFSTDPHHVCEAVVLLERITGAYNGVSPSRSVIKLSASDEWCAAFRDAVAYVARRREAQGEANGGR